MISHISLVGVNKFPSTSADNYRTKTDSGNERFIENSLARRGILIQSNENENMETGVRCGEELQS